MSRTTCVAGLLQRRAVRAQLDYLGLEWIEHKGLLSSTFVIRGETTEVKRFRSWLLAAGAEPM